MKTTITSSTMRSVYVLATVLLSIGTLVTAHAAPEPARSAAAQSLNFEPIAARSSARRAKAPVTVFVRFDTPSVAESLIAAQALGVAQPGRVAQRAHAKLIATEQAVQRNNLEALGCEVLSSMRVGANGLRVRVHPDEIPVIRTMPGVRSVAPVEIHTLDLTNSVPWVGAPPVWDNSGDGSGITIAVIDTGADYLHANLGGSGDPNDYAANDPNVLEDKSFPNDKVIGGWDFAGPVYDAISDDPNLQIPMPDPDPLDGDGHGSHVSGIAAGLGVPGSIGPGVAKGASIYAFKVFGDIAGSTDLTSDAIEMALDPNGDGDMSDMVDVINMSLGSPFGSPDDPSAIAATNAADLGIIVVASAGNSGAVPYVTGAPAVGPNVISVAATISGGDVLALGVQTPPARGLYEAVEGAGAVRIADGAVTDLVIAEPLQACSANTDGNPTGLDNDIAGGIALVQRGACSFDLKYLNAQMSGASSIVVYNDGADPSRIAPITMGGVGGLGIPITIPGLMIASTAGDFLNATITGGDALKAVMDAGLMTPTAFGDSMAGFSSQGPGHGGSRFKPDIAAPGVSTISTGAGSGTEAAALSGTSMASPHVAGAGALMRQAFPDASVATIKAMLMNSTVDAQPDGLVGPPHALSRQGVGVLRVDNAAALTSFARPAGVAFGRINSKNPTRRRARVRVSNLSKQDRYFKITHIPQQEMAGVSISVPDSIWVRAGRSKRFRAVLEFDPAKAQADDGSFSQTEVDGWFMLNDGVDTLRVGYVAVVDPASKVRGKGRRGAVRLRNNGRSDGIAEGFTLSLVGDDDNGSDDYDRHDYDSDDYNKHDYDSDYHDAPNTAAVRALGFRTGVVSGFEVVEFGIDLHEAWESMSNRTFDLFLDVDNDGKDDVQLQATDFSDFGGAIGTMVTAQFDLVGGGAFLDWFVSIGDFNDTTAAFMFTREASGGLVPDSFDYRLEVTSFAPDGGTDVEFGSIDLADEIIPDEASLSIDAGDRLTIPTNGMSGEMLWLFQNNRVGKQSDIVRVR